MASEEFTFPIISNDTSPATIDSPPLWHLSPASSPEPYFHHRKEENKFLCIQRKSCSDIPNPNSNQDEEEDQEEEEKDEKMDVLWEDFNEELYKAKSTNLEEFSHDMVEMGCVQALKLSSSSSSKANGVIFSSSSSTSKNGNGNKAGNMLVFMKVLKKLFLLQHHHQQQQHHHRSIKVRDVKWKT